ncbi:hypothetical protein HPB50_014827 [Hyalomma asiaticum]|uniref:Uncharacterized protein n=1 Tax=Hyalomma asiaticum TaxID=266040 RepID=A0ACB7THU5_HYAAI|nr:hypothetical protein HPB50_014827 [Hyalomma asiaticum]
MTNKDLETLCANMSKASAEQLRELNDGEVIPLPPLDGVSKSEAVFEIIETLRGISLPSVRLQYIANFYVWLSVNKVLSSWTVYSVNPLKVPHVYFNVHREIARAVGGRDHSLVFVTSVSPAARYACIMTPYVVPGRYNTLSSVCASGTGWTTWPYVQ